MSTPNTIVGHAANNALVAYIKHGGNYRVIGGCNVSGANLRLFIRKYVGGMPLLGWGIMKQIFGVRRGRGWARRARQRGHGRVLACRAQGMGQGGMGVSSSSLLSYSCAIPLSRCHVVVPLHCRVVPSLRSCIVVSSHCGIMSSRRCVVMLSCRRAIASLCRHLVMLSSHFFNLYLGALPCWRAPDTLWKWLDLEVRWPRCKDRT
jgi:hypothetical protein